MDSTLATDSSETDLAWFLDRMEGWVPGKKEKDLAKEWTTWLDEAVRNIEPLSPLWIRTLHRIAAICNRSRTTLPNIKEVDIHELAWFGYNHDFTDFLMRTPIASDGPVDLYKCRREGRYIAVKDFRQRKVDLDKLVFWSQLRHRNLVPFVGRLSVFGYALASEWMDNGNIIHYLRVNHQEDRTRYVSDIVSGLAFLHGLGIIYASLKGASTNNVLIDADKTARLADPGMTGRKIQYMAPELDEIKGRTTQEADLFALAYVLAELFLPPIPLNSKRGEQGLPEDIRQSCFFHPDMDILVMKRIERNARLQRPQNAHLIGLTDALWDAICQCWDEQPIMRRSGWNRLVTILNVQPQSFNVAYAQEVARNIEKETRRDDMD